MQDKGLDGVLEYGMMSGLPGRDPQPIAVRVSEFALPPGQPLFIDGRLELLRHCMENRHDLLLHGQNTNELMRHQTAGRRDVLGPARG